MAKIGRPGGKTKAFLVERVYERHGALTKDEAAEVVDTIFGALKASLVDGKTVRIKNFGVFDIVARAGRSGVNPTSGEPIYIPPHKGLQFRPAKSLKDEVEVLPRKKR
jgi:nucleoid DNA-binding protein